MKLIRATYSTPTAACWNARRQRNRRVGDLVPTLDRTLPQRDVHRPVVASRRRELAGAVQRVDDPHPVGLEPGQIVVGFLAEHRVIGGYQGSKSREVLMTLPDVDDLLDRLGLE